MTEGDSERAPDLRFIVNTGQGHKGESDDSAGHCLGGRRESRNEFWALVRVWTKLSVFTAVPTSRLHLIFGAARIDKTLTNPSCSPTNQKCLRLTDTRKWLTDDEMREVIATPCADKPKVLAGQLKSEMQETDQAFVMAWLLVVFYFSRPSAFRLRTGTGSQPASTCLEINGHARRGVRTIHHSPKGPRCRELCYVVRARANVHARPQVHIYWLSSTRESV